MQTQAGANADDAVAGTVALLSKIKYSRHSDYVDKSTRSINKRLLSDGLVLHERATAAEVGDLLEQAGVRRRAIFLSQVIPPQYCARGVCLCMHV